MNADPMTVAAFSVAATAALGIFGWLLLRQVQRPEEDLKDTRTGIRSELVTMRSEMKNDFTEVKADIRRISENHATHSERLMRAETELRGLGERVRDIENKTPNPAGGGRGQKRRRTD